MSDSRGIKIYKEIMIILKANEVLTAYIPAATNMFGGIPPDDNNFTTYPNLILEPINEPEDPATIPGNINAEYVFKIYGIANHAIYENQIIGDDNEKGIMQVAADIKNALSAYPNLEKSGANLCESFSFITDYSVLKYPERMVTITMNVKKQLLDTGR